MRREARRVMEPIKTVSTLERIIRNGVMAVMVVVFAAYFLYDGFVGYPRKNLEQARQILPPDEQDKAYINQKVTSDCLGDIAKNDRLTTLEARLGPPAWKGLAKDNVFKAVWFGPGGSLTVRYDMNEGTVLSSRWKKGQKKELDLWIQKVLGYSLGPVGILLLIRVVLMLLRGAQLSDAGLKPSGRPLIPFEAMTGWDVRDYRDKGRIALTYALDRREGTYVLDDYKLRAFPAIVTEICRRKGFENPLKKDESSPGGRRVDVDKDV